MTAGALDVFAIVVGLFLGLTILKFGNPIILNDKVGTPRSWSDAWSDAWPPVWGIGLLAPLILWGVWLSMRKARGWPASRWLWILPTIWFGWQLISATHTVYGQMTKLTLWHFGGCLAFYLAGALVLGSERGLRLMLFGLLAAFSFCMVRAAEQRLFEFPQGRQMLVEGQRTAWTNFPPAEVLQMKVDGLIVSTNGVDVANPMLLAKYEKGRVHGTLVYPNALAGTILLLLPAAIVLAMAGTRRFRSGTRVATIVLTLFLGAGGLFWTGSKSGWLIAMVLGGVWLLRLKWSTRAKASLIVALAAVSLLAFGIRFRAYLASGATSVGARLDYWRAAARITGESPVFGTGPGTFQRPYERLKSPEAEMARLTHNDYLEQFSDSGIIGGVSYLTWITLLLTTIGRRVFRCQDPLWFALFLGLLGWFVQGVSEFSLYVPALAWTAFALAGCLLKLTGNPFDKIPAGR